MNKGTLFGTHGFVVLSSMLVIAVLTGCVTRQSPEELLNLNVPTEPSDISVKRLVAEMEKASDPKGVFKNAKTYIMRQSFVDLEDYEKNQIANQYEMEIRFRKPDWLRQTSSREGRPFAVLLYRDGKAWTIDPKSKKVTPLSGKQLELFKAYKSITNPAMSYTDVFPDINIAVVRAERKRQYRLICRTGNPEIAPYVIYIDAETFLPAKTETILYTDDGGEYVYTAETSDYRWSHNVRLPFSTIITIAGKKDLCTMTNFAVNVDFPKSVFEPNRPRLR